MYRVDFYSSLALSLTVAMSVVAAAEAVTASWWLAGILAVPFFLFTFSVLTTICVVARRVHRAILYRADTDRRIHAMTEGRKSI